MLAYCRLVTALALGCAALSAVPAKTSPGGSSFLCGAALLSSPIEQTPDQMLLPNVFHIVGVPGVKRNGRVDLDLSSQSLVVRQGGVERLSIPFGRLRRLQVLNGKRSYAKATYAAVLGAGLGGLLVLRKSKRVDTLVFDFVNERGGEMGLVLQVPEGKGADCIEWLRRYGIAAEEREPLPPAPAGGSPQ
jgi:hypothetical protein